MNPLADHQLLTNRRHFLGSMSQSLGGLALASLLDSDLAGRKLLARDRIAGAGIDGAGRPASLADSYKHFAPKAKRIIWLFQSGGPSQLDLWDYKPQLQDRFAQEVPTSVYPAERKTTMSSGQVSFPTAPSLFKFAQHGACGTWVSELQPHVATLADDLCVIKSMFTEAINHDPAITFFQTGSQIAGRPSIGAWLNYGLGSDNSDLPAFVAMSSRGTGKKSGQPLYDRLWGSGFLPAHYQGVKFRNQGSPVLDIENPDGIESGTRRVMLDHLTAMNQLGYQEMGDPEILARIAQYELAYRMQTAVPELLDLSQESQHTLNRYGPEATKQGSYAFNCLTARRLAERGVRFIQLFHQGWDQHDNLPQQIRGQCLDTDQATAALVNDLKQRGMLDDTIVVWGGEFGRTVYSQGTLNKHQYGRDHHPSCFSLWLAGAGIRGGLSYGATDDYSANVVDRPVPVHDLHATLLHLMGIDHKRLTYKYQGRDFRLTDVHGRVVHDLLS